MNRTPLTNMEGRYITPATEEAFNALVKMGYKTKLWSLEGTEFLKIEIPLKSVQYRLGKEPMIFKVGDTTVGLKQAYYHKGHFYDQPYEEFTITEEKVPFPELKYDDNYTPIIKTSSAMFEIDKEDFDSLYEWALNLENKKSWLYIQQFDQAKKKIFLKSIDRRLHKNRPLALAIGRWLVKNPPIECAGNSLLFAIGQYGIKSLITGNNTCFYVDNDWVSECTLPDDYIIQDQVIEWMHEYEKELLNA